MQSLKKAIVGAAFLATALIPASALAGNEAGAFVGGLIVGGALGRAAPIYNPPVYVTPVPRVYVQPAPTYVVPQGGVYVQPGYGQAGFSAHQQWCMQRYRSYNIQTDTYVSNSGIIRYCNSPYN
jgi:hypothetical protein